MSAIKLKLQLQNGSCYPRQLLLSKTAAAIWHSIYSYLFYIEIGPLLATVTSGLYYKNIMSVNDATSWSITLELAKMLPESSISHQLCSQRKFIVQASLMMIVI